LHLVTDRESTPVESREQLVEHFREAAKPREAWRVGTEYEMVGVRANGSAPGQAPPYEGEAGIAAVFAGFAERRWKEVREEGHIIALTCSDAQVTFEPGGQLEHAMRPMLTSAELDAEIARNTARLRDISRPLGLAWLDIGLRPFATLADVPWMPKQRYAIMREYLPTRGALAQEMMLRTATVQVNLDFSDADDALAKMRCVQSVTPILTSLWANSPIVDEQLTDYQSYRARVWLETDPDRCGLLPFLHEDGDVFSAYADWALDVPMFFVHRGGSYHLAGDMTFRRFWRDGWSGERATMDDWALHLSTLFPEIRLKTYLEVRGCDVGSVPMMVALGALTRGILHDETARREATRLTAALSFAERLALAAEVPRAGLRARAGRATLGDLARSLLAIAEEGLRRQTPEEIPYLAPVQEIAASGRTQADAVADMWRACGGDRARMIQALAYPGLDGR
jgi:glutamate--cysteine ligase